MSLAQGVVLSLEGGRGSQPYCPLPSFPAHKTDSLPQVVVPGLSQGFPRKRMEQARNKAACTWHRLGIQVVETRFLSEANAHQTQYKVCISPNPPGPGQCSSLQFWAEGPSTQNCAS